MSKSLFDLIKTLSKAEKRVFSENLKSTKRMKFYSNLVALYSKSEVFTPQLDLKVFKSESPKFVSDCKTKCKHLLWDYLVSLEKNKGIGQQIEQKLNIAMMLFCRKQFAEANKIMEKIDKQAQIYEFHELMVKIKTLKLYSAANLSGINGEVDLIHFKTLIEDKYKALDRFVALHHKLEEGRLMCVKSSINLGRTIEKPGSQKVAIDHYKNLKTTFLTRHWRYEEFMTNKDWSNALDELIFILDLAEKNKKVFLKAKILGDKHTVYLRSCIKLNYRCNRGLDVEELLYRFDEIKPRSIFEQCIILIDKTVSYSVHALATNNPDFAIVELEKQELFYKETNFSQAQSYLYYRYYLFVYLATKKWDKCIEYIDKTVEKGGGKWNHSLLETVRLICIYEKGELHYFNSLVDQFMSKRRKNGVKIKDCSNFSNCVFNVLYFLAKGSKIDLQNQLNGILKTYDRVYMETRYLIHWIVCQLPELNNADYSAFLEQNHFKHFDFNENANNHQYNSQQNYESRIRLI